jgi:hypothetical protein
MDVNATERTEHSRNTIRLLRIASAVHDRLVQFHQHRKTEAMSSISRVSETLDELRAVQRRFGWAEQRSMPVALDSQMEQAARQVRILACQLGEIQHVLDNSQQPPPKSADMPAELAQAEEEFDQTVKFDRAADTLSLTTDRIELDGIDLGRFEIQLRLNDLGRANHGHAYQVIAKDPNPASGNDHVTHPHVSHDALCEGDASSAIRNAIAGGRLGDFFTLVRSVLQTYNPDSPYVRLDDWDGTPCYDCGSSIGSDDLSFCERCEHDFCESCIASCRACGTTYCRECLTRCESCERYYCESCAAHCDQCGEAVCTSCLVECAACEQKVCDGCLKACTGCNRRLCVSCVKDDLCKECLDKQQPTPPEEQQPHEQEQPQEPPQAPARRGRRAVTRRRRRPSRAATAVAATPSSTGTAHPSAA